MNRSALKALLIKHETVNGRPNLKPYTDTKGKLTIGVGRNLTDDGISREESDFLFDNDLNEVFKVMPGITPSFGSLDDTRQHVLMDMCFNMGPQRLRGFTKMLAAIEARDWPTAADEMLASAWAREVGQRAIDLATMMRQDQG